MPNFPARYNIAPTQPVPVVVQDVSGRHFRLMRWGLLPAWVKDPRTFALVINARAETVRDKPAFRNALKRRRCLLPADGYYEWQASETRKRPFFIHRRDGAPMAFAGLAETWVGPNGEELDTVAIITTAAPADLAPLHHRVPVTVSESDFARWLDCAATDVNAAMALVGPPLPGDFVWHEVSTAVNRVANDDLQLILPVAADAVSPPPSPAPKKRAKTKTETRPDRAKPSDDGQGSLF
jgi:putative SOS response-associated peptidase YedK